MKVDANNHYGLAMSQEIPNGKFDWLSVGECRVMEQQLNFMDGCIAIFDLGLFDYRVLDAKSS